MKRKMDSPASADDARNRKRLKAQPSDELVRPLRALCENLQPPVSEDALDEIGSALDDLCEASLTAQQAHELVPQLQRLLMLGLRDPADDADSAWTDVLDACFGLMRHVWLTLSAGGRSGLLAPLVNFLEADDFDRGDGNRVDAVLNCLARCSGVAPVLASDLHSDGAGETKHAGDGELKSLSATRSGPAPTQQLVLCARVLRAHDRDAGAVRLLERCVCLSRIACFVADSLLGCVLNCPPSR
jgi:hypothetical protein